MPYYSRSMRNALRFGGANKFDSSYTGDTQFVPANFIESRCRVYGVYRDRETRTLRRNMGVRRQNRCHGAMRHRPLHHACTATKPVGVDAHSDPCRHHRHGINPIISAQVSAVRPCEFYREPRPRLCCLQSSGKPSHTVGRYAARTGYESADIF